MLFYGDEKTLSSPTIFDVARQNKYHLKVKDFPFENYCVMFFNLNLAKGFLKNKNALNVFLPKIN